MRAEELVKSVAELLNMSLDSPSLTSAVKLFREKVDNLAVNLDLCDRIPTVLILDKVSISKENIKKCLIPELYVVNFYFRLHIIPM